MSWGGGGGANYNPNAQSWTPPGQQQNQQQGGYNQQQQGGYNQNQQQGGWGGQQPQQQGGYNQQNQGGYNQQQQGGYQNQQGGYNQQQGGYNQNQGYGNQGGYNQNQGYGNQGGYNQQQQAGVPAPASQQAPAPAPAPVVETVQPIKSSADKNKLKLDLGGGNKKKKNDFVMPKKGGGGGGFSLSAPGGNVMEKPEEKKPEAEASTEEKKPEEKKASKGFSLGGAKEEEKKVEEAPVEESPKDESPAGSPTTETEATKDEESKDEEEKPEAAEEKKVEKGSKDQKKMRVQKEYKRDPRPHHNVVFCGHVDAGKSTISGHILADVGVVDEREMAKLKREAESNHREGWEFAYCMDVSEEERAKGKTHETGAAYFETDKKRITILDAPGHKAFVPSMIGGAAQADVCVLVISARTGEFETGFENGGQSREHAMLVRACGVKHMICAINKMDDQNWEVERYNEIKSKLEPFLKQNGYAEKAKNLFFMPISGLSGEGLVHPVTKAKWYKGPSLVQYINDLVLEEKRSEDDDLVMPVAGAYKDEGKIYIYGKIESGSICVGDRLTILPLKNELIVEAIQIEGANIDKAYPSDNCHLVVRGVDEAQVHAGYVIVMEPTPLKVVDYFQARIIVLEVKNLLSNGSRMMMNLGVAEQEVSIHKILGKLDPKSQEVKVIEKEPTHVRARESFMARLELSQSMVVEDHKKFDKLGRFMLREEGRTVAIGLITKLYESTKEQVDNGTAPKQK